MTVSRRFLAKLEAARAAPSHSRPNATMEEILEAGLDLVLGAHAKRKGLVEKPRKEAPAFGDAWMDRYAPPRRLTPGAARGITAG